MGVTIWHASLTRPVHPIYNQITYVVLSIGIAYVISVCVYGCVCICYACQSYLYMCHACMYMDVCMCVNLISLFMSYVMSLCLWMYEYMCLCLSVNGLHMLYICIIYVLYMYNLCNACVYMYMDACQPYIYVMCVM